MADTGVFDRLAPFVQDFIYEHDWESLRAIQVAAADAILTTEDNVLLTSSTASGKTEAAFFPILTQLWEDPPATVGCIYVGPLKALHRLSLHRAAQGPHQRPVLSPHGPLRGGRHPRMALAWGRLGLAQGAPHEAPLGHPADHARVA